MHRIIRGMSAAALLAVGSCESLDVANPNEPDANRALSDPQAIEGLAAGAMQTWFNMYTNLQSAGVLATQARSYSSSWNNGWLNYHSGIDIAATDTTTSPATWTRNARGWQNDPSASVRTSVEAFWAGGRDEAGVERPGFYAALAAANTALQAIRRAANPVVIGDAARTKRLETIATLMQGASLMMIALNYDKGYIVTDSTDLTTLTYSTRREVRDAAIAKLQQARSLSLANTFTTDGSWANGPTYTNQDIARVASTMSALTLAWYPRDASEVAAVNWGQVATYASTGMSTGSAPVDWRATGDGYNNWISELMCWFNGIDGGRVSTRVAHFMDPKTQVDPYRLGVGSAQPSSVDRRMGDGSFGTEAMVRGFTNIPRTANAGTDFAYLRQGQVFRPDRGYYHQSNIGHIRYDASGEQDPSDVYGCFGVMPAIMAIQNDLIWAEALLRQGGAGVAQAITLINKTRVGRGGLSPAAGATGSDADGPCMTDNPLTTAVNNDGVLAKDGGACTIWSMLLYEAEVELLGLGAAAFYHHRRLPVLTATNWERIGGPSGTSIFNGPRYIQGLIPGTPREMPVPAKELGVKGEALYTYGGTAPPKGPVP